MYINNVIYICSYVPMKIVYTKKNMLILVSRKLAFFLVHSIMLADRSNQYFSCVSFIFMIYLLFSASYIAMYKEPIQLMSIQLREVNRNFQIFKSKQEP